MSMEIEIEITITTEERCLGLMLTNFFFNLYLYVQKPACEYGM
jgi:hypothetical protein